MNKQHTQKLIDDFPQLYRGHTDGAQTNLMCFGFECGDGWYNLIYQLSKEIDSIAKMEGLEGEDYPKAFQVKEKFGGLRFSFDNGVPKEVLDTVNRAEEISHKTCEVCGCAGSHRTRGFWVMTRCDEHAPKQEEVDETD